MPLFCNGEELFAFGGLREALGWIEGESKAESGDGRIGEGRELKEGKGNGN